MAAKALPIYLVYCMTKYGCGVQAVKARNAILARKKFRKRFPNQRVLGSPEKADDKTAYIILSQAI